MNKIIASFFIFSLVMSASAFALPCAFFGTAAVDGESVSGTGVEAYVDGVKVASGKAILGLGNYSIAIDQAGKNIIFKISGATVIQSAQDCVSGATKYLDLSASTVPDGSSCTQDAMCASGYCVHEICRNSDPYSGDGYCDSGEDCTNSADCSCGAPSGGGGGSGPITTCTEIWTCSDWSACVEGVQTRTCSDSNSCGTTKTRPALTQTCDALAFSNLQTNETDESGASGAASGTPQGDSGTNGASDGQESSTPLTGMFLGVMSGQMLGALLLALAAALILIFLVMKRKKSKK